MVPEGDRLAVSIPRIHASPVKYYFIDYDISDKFDKDAPEPRLTSNYFGREKEAPDLRKPVPYDPFILDVFIIGKVYKRAFLEV